MGVRRALIRALTVGVTVAALAGSAVVAAPAQAAGNGRIVGMRTQRYPHLDRLIFEVQGPLPQEVALEYVDGVTEDATGSPVYVPGQAILRMRLFSVDAHDDQGRPTVPGRAAFAMNNLFAAVRAGDYEGVVTYGFGVAVARPASIYTLHNPNRVIVEVDTHFARVPAKVWFMDRDNFNRGVEPYTKAVKRRVPAAAPAAAVMDRLFAGPAGFEREQGLRFVASRADRWSNLAIEDGIARVRLRGKCRSGGSTFTIANEIMPMLKQFPTVDYVKIQGPGGQTESPTGRSDSIPTCLEP